MFYNYLKNFKIGFNLLNISKLEVSILLKIGIEKPLILIISRTFLNPQFS